MKKYYCMFERKNHPFSWKLKPAKEEIVAYFKSRRDCINYYLSLKVEGSIWFQKSENDVAKGLIPRFEGTLKTVNINNTLIHAIYFHKSNKILNEKETLARLYKIWKIDSKTGEDLVLLKGQNRRELILNSYLTFNEFNEFMKNKRLAEAKQSQERKPIAVEEVEVVEEKPEPPIIEDKKTNHVEINETQSAPSVVINFNVNEKKVEVEKDNEPIPIQEIKSLEIENEPPKEEPPKKEKIEEEEKQIDTDDDEKSTIDDETLNRILDSSSLFDTEYVKNTDNDSFNLDDIDDFQNYNSKFPNYNSNNQNSYKKEILEYNNLDNSIFEWQQLNQYGDPYMQQKRFINNTGYIQYPNGTVEFTAVPGQTLNTAVNPLGSETMIITTPQYTTNAIYQPATVYDTSLVKAQIAPSVVTEVTRTEYYTPGGAAAPFAYPQPYDYATQQMPVNQPVVQVPVYVPTQQVTQQVAPESYSNNANAKKANGYDTLEEDIKSIKQGIEKLKEDFRETSVLSFSNERDTQEIPAPAPIIPVPAPIFPPPPPYQPEPPRKQHPPRKPQPNPKASKNPNQNNRNNMQKQQTKVAVKKKKDPLSIILIIVAVLILIGTAVFLGLYFGTDIFKNLF